MHATVSQAPTTFLDTSHSVAGCTGKRHCFCMLPDGQTFSTDRPSLRSTSAFACGNLKQHILCKSSSLENSTGSIYFILFLPHAFPSLVTDHSKLDVVVLVNGSRRIISIAGSLVFGSEGNADVSEAFLEVFPVHPKGTIVLCHPRFEWTARWCRTALKNANRRKKT